MYHQRIKSLARAFLVSGLAAGMLSAQGLTITPQNLPPGSVSVAYLPLTLVATGGTPPYSWSVIPGGLVTSFPPGMSLSGDGVLSGQPTSTGLFTPTLRVMDSAGTVATQMVSLNVTPAASLLPHAGVVAQLAAGSGWDTTIYLVNTSTTAFNSVTITFRGDNGNPLSVAVTTSQPGYPQTITNWRISLTLSPATTVLVHTAAAPTDPLQQGWADIAAQTGLGSYAIFRHTSPSGVIAEGTSAQQGNLQPSLIMPFDNTSNGDTGMGLVSLSSGPATITATVWDEAGNRLGAPFTLPPLNAMGHTAFSIAAQFPVTAGKRGFVRLDNSTPDALSAIGLSSPAVLGDSFTSVPTLPAPPI